MRSFFHLFIAALGGGLLAAAVVLTTLHLWPAGNRAVDAASFQAAPPAGGQVPAFFTGYDGSIGALPDNLPNLKAAARLATPTAVHIASRSADLPVDAIKRLFQDRADGPPPSDGEGSGVIYNEHGYVVTNYHVVRGAGEIRVRMSDRRSYAARLIGQDPKSDLAVLKIEGEEKFPYLEIADSDLAEPGEWVLAVGNPLGLTSTVTAGIVSAKGRNISLLKDLDAIESFIQTDAAVNPGNSGGPLVSADGKLLGINTAIASRTGRFQGYSFAIPSNLVRRVVDDIIEYGSYRRAFLGVDISTLTEADIGRLRLKNRAEGVIIDAIIRDGSAEAAGLRKDDVVVRVGERAIRDLPELTEIIGRAKVGETLNISVVRDGKVLKVVVPMLNYPE